jgi:hypothetical protein
VLTPGADNGNGDIFISPFGDTSSYANGAEIINNAGHVIWFHPVPAGQEASDFRTQTYLGHPVLTWWQGTGLGGLSAGTDYIYNDRYQQIATVQAGNGYSADGHEFLITPWNTALILSYATATANLTSIGGPPDQEVIDGIVQEIDARDTWTTYKVSLRTGKIIWQLGGKDSSFAIKAAPGQVLDSAGEAFAWQHDPEAVGHDTYTFFDNESSGPPELPYSRAITVRLNERARTATLIASDDQPEGLSAASQGNVQTTRNHDLFVGWGILPYISEFSPSGQLLFNAEFPAGVNTYRAYRLPWPSGGGRR